MGEVLLAEDRCWAVWWLKFLPRSQAADPVGRERLQREARALAALSHPNIARVHALESVGDQTFLVMEYVEGERSRSEQSLARNLSRSLPNAG
jgi:serine/threonine protein kinase